MYGALGIPYGYENVLPISQRYKQNPYSMLSSIGTDTETMTCTSDGESEYSRSDYSRFGQSHAKNSRMQMMKSTIVKNTVVEEEPFEEMKDDSRYKKRLALSETSIWNILMAGFPCQTILLKSRLSNFS